MGMINSGQPATEAFTIFLAEASVAKSLKRKISPSYKTGREPILSASYPGRTLLILVRGLK